ncbi:MAG: ABC transporter ATP-binding protein [Clostridia bacterium]|nr:ABC transporter ATP-binding protein [Clostridia bacterium]
MSKQKKSNHHNIFQNLWFIARHMHMTDKTVFRTYLARIPMYLILSMGGMFMPTVIIALIERDEKVSVILSAIAVISVVLILARYVWGRVEVSIMCKNQDINRRFEMMLCTKMMDMDYEMLETPSIRIKQQKALNSFRSERVGSFVYWIFTTFGVLVGFLGISAVISTLSPVIIVLLIVSFAIPFLFDKYTDKLVNRTKEKRAEIDRHLNYVTRSSRDFYMAKDIRLFAIKECFVRIAEYFTGEKKFWTSKVYFYYFLSDIVKALMTLIVTGGAYAYLIYMCTTSDLSGAELVLYITAILEFNSYVINIVNHIDEIIECNYVVNDFREFLDIENVMKNYDGQPVPQADGYTIDVRNLSFTYPESEEPVLENVNLHIDAGEKIAIVGLNGSGKSTLVKLLCGLYRPTEGEILLNGVNISEFNRDEYYKLISAVFQDIRIMPVSIAENISMRPMDETDIEMVKVCIELSGLSKKVEGLKDGIETKLMKNLNKDAQELSGGELQKMLLARAIYKQSPIIILDEPTAALDPIAENDMYLKYNKLTKGKISVYISHRLSSTRFCDRIVLIDNKTITESGTHDELMALNGKYAEIFNIQMQYYKKESERNEAEREA